MKTSVVRTKDKSNKKILGLIATIIATIIVTRVTMAALNDTIEEE